jgi:hypothetical protein
MQNEAIFIIDEQGNMRFLLTEAAIDCLIDGSVSQRASHVEPDSACLRFIFHLLRRFLGDKGRMSEFTRTWPCLWRVNATPVGGMILHERFRNRQQAIEAEVQYLNKFFTGEIQ